MRTFLLAMLFTGALASFSAANAAGGCGPGWHRGAYGACVRDPVVVVPGAVVVERPVVVAPRACPYGFVWAYGRCRPI
jgi:hypothetical protein